MTRVITWNMEGATHSQASKWANGVTILVTRAQADVLTLQEAGPLPPSSVPVPAAGVPPWMAGHAPPAGAVWSFVTWSAARIPCWILWLQTRPPANRVNLAVLTTALPTALWYVAPGLAAGRPAIGVRLAGEDVFTLHGLSGSGADDPGLITNIQAAVGAGNAFYAGGDYNREPPGWVPPAGVLCPPDAITRWPSKRKLDYMVKHAPVQQGTVISTLVLSDHYPVLYDI